MQAERTTSHADDTVAANTRASAPRVEKGIEEDVLLVACAAHGLAAARTGTTSDGDEIGERRALNTNHKVIQRNASTEELAEESLTLEVLRLMQALAALRGSDRARALVGGLGRVDVLRLGILPGAAFEDIDATCVIAAYSTSLACGTDDGIVEIATCDVGVAGVGTTNIGHPNLSSTDGSSVVVGFRPVGWVSRNSAHS